jgi:hypothetical protein
LRSSGVAQRGLRLSRQLKIIIMYEGRRQHGRDLAERRAVPAQLAEHAIVASAVGGERDQFGEVAAGEREPEAVLVGRHETSPLAGLAAAVSEAQGCGDDGIPIP